MKIPSSVGRVAIAAGALLVLGGSAVGIAAAQSQPASTPTPYQKFVDALAQRLGVSSQQLETDISQARQDAGLPTNGGFPGGGRGGPGGRGPGAGFGPGLNFQTAANAIGISVQQLRTEIAGKSLAQVAQNHGKSGTVPQNTNLSQGAQPAAQNGAAPNGTGNPNGRGPRRGFGFGAGTLQQGLDVAAQAIGISADQLRAELPGKSLAQVAQNHNKNASDVATALKNAAHQQIGTRIDQLVNQVLPQRAPRGNGGADETEQS
jgi:hypothetical protein